MILVYNTREVFDAMQQAKAGSPSFTTNFFPAQRKVQGWIARAEMLTERHDHAALFLRKDQDFWHLYFCAASPEALQRAINSSALVKTAPIVVDLVGNDPGIKGLITVLGAVGFRPYRRLFRMAKLISSSPIEDRADAPAVQFAEIFDSRAILDLIFQSLDRYAEQLPTPQEIESATANRQILAVKCDGELAGLLFFETQGLTSTVRYWLVAERFRARWFGAVLMRHYFAVHLKVRRFILWVMADNEDAIKKYRHYGFAPDGLVDQVLVNGMIHS